MEIFLKIALLLLNKYVLIYHATNSDLYMDGDGAASATYRSYSFLLLLFHI